MVVTPRITDGFIGDDLRILHGMVHVVPFELEGTRAARGGVLGRVVGWPLLLLHFAARLLLHDVRVVVFWFATRHYAPMLALAARLLGRRVVVVTGGVDAVYVPEIDWGEMKSRSHRAGFGLLMRLAHAVLPFSGNATESIRSRFRARRVETAYPAVDTDYFRPGAGPRERRLVTCCYAISRHNIVQKGLDRFAEAARLLPSVPFCVVGDAVDDAARAWLAQLPANVAHLPRIRSRAGYRDLLASSAVYAQLSVHEGFGVSVAEAMAAGCIAVVTNRYSLPEVVGDQGEVVPYGDGASTARAISRALNAPAEARQRSRARACERFPRALRRDRWREELSRLIPELHAPRVRVELGCGSTGVAGTIGVDARQTVQTSAVCDVRFSCFRTGVADEVYSFCVLEHLDDPYQLLDEVVRVLKPGGRAYLRVPNLGTYSAHLDMTHRFLADLRLWRDIMNGYFDSVAVVPAGTKYRDNALLVLINLLLVHGLRFHELAQGWTFVCTGPRAAPTRGYVGWWQEPGAEG